MTTKAPKCDDGIKPRANYIQFGKLMLNTKLLLSNILLLKYPKSYAPVNGLLRTTISNDVKDIIYYILDTKQINYESIRELNKKDNDLMLKIMDKSGLDVIFRIDRTKMTENIDEIVERFKIIQGEIGAGNSNIEPLINEAKILLKKLLKYERIDENTYNEIIEELDQTI